MTNLPITTNSNGHLNRRAVVAAGALGAAAFLGAGTALAKVGEDAELLELFEDWKVTDSRPDSTIVIIGVLIIIVAAIAAAITAYMG